MPSPRQLFAPISSLLSLSLCLGACNPLSTGDALQLPSAERPREHALGQPSTVAAVEAKVLKLMQDQGLPGMSLSLVHNGSICYAGSYGSADVETERPLSAQTPVLLSSTSKTFLGVAAAQALDAGRIQLDDPVEDYLDFDIDAPWADEHTITLRHLLTHNSGIRDSAQYSRAYAPGDPELGLEAFMRDYLSKDGKLRRRANFNREGPGHGFEYSNVGAALAGLALGNAAGLEFSELVRRDILTPLSMAQAAYHLDDLAIEPAVPYELGDDNVVRPWPQYSYPTYPDGAMRASALDMARYLAAAAGGGQLDGVQLASPESWAQTLTVDPDYGSDESGQAIAWAMREYLERRLIGHNGGDFGSAAELWFDPANGDGFVFMMNSEPADWTEVFEFERYFLDSIPELCGQPATQG